MSKKMIFLLSFISASIITMALGAMESKRAPKEAERDKECMDSIKSMCNDALGDIERML